MKKFAILLLTLLITLGSINANATPTEDTDLDKVISESVAKVMSAINTERTKDGELVDVETLNHNLNSILEKVIDFDSIAKAVMGKHYRTASKEQYVDFSTIFREEFVKLYSSILLKLEITDLQVVDSNIKDGARATATMKVDTSAGQTYTVSYSLRKDVSGQWKVRNVILDGINLGLTYRNQFDSAMNTYDGNIAQVIKDWPDTISR